MSERRTEYLPLSQLQPDPRNPKSHDLETMRDSMTRFGYVEIITRDDRTGYIVSGHGRRTSLIQRREHGEKPPTGVKVREDGEWLVPVTVGWSSQSDTEAVAALIALNRTTELGGWVDDALLEALRSLDGSLDGTGFTDEDMRMLTALQHAVTDDSNPESGDMVDFDATYEVVISCRNESEQEDLLEELSIRGLNVRALTA